jgi:hypothetical protein
MKEGAQMGGVGVAGARVGSLSLCPVSATAGASCAAIVDTGTSFIGVPSRLWPSYARALGGAAGALIGGAATGRAGGALAGGLIGAAAGGIIGANSEPARRCVRIRYDYDGNRYCARYARY